MSSLLPDIQKKSKKQIAYERIKEEIISNKLKPGTMLVERQLCKSLDTSRTPIREALHQLRSEGLVDFTEGKGGFVAAVTYEDIVEIYNIREVLEGLACRLCALLITDKEVDYLEEKYRLLQKAVMEKDYNLFVEQDVKFHNCIIESSRNIRLKYMINNMIDQIRRITHYITDDETRIMISHEHHDRILKAIKNKDPNEAEAIMKEHIRNSKEYHANKILGYKYLVNKI